jgi:hypothetical protein
MKKDENPDALGAFERSPDKTSQNHFTDDNREGLLTIDL